MCLKRIKQQQKNKKKPPVCPGRNVVSSEFQKCINNTRNTISKNKPQIFACTHRNRVKAKTPNKYYTSDRASKNFTLYFVLMGNKKIILKT